MAFANTDKFLTDHTIQSGSTSISINLTVLDAGLKSPVPGLNQNALCAAYFRQGGIPTYITLIPLAAYNSVWASGGVKEIDPTLFCGRYRLDVPDPAFASGAD